MGIYITTAVKSPKSSYTVDPAVIEAQLPILEAELALFPNLKVIMLMGDVAKKAVNMITKTRTKKNVIPSGATGRLRNNEYYWGGIRVMPSYIMTGKNLLIEPFKRDCVTEDIRRMTEIVK
jgi:uracil-DNA glycosylase